MTVDETGVDETVVDETGVDKLGINHINTSVGNELGLSYHKCQKPPPPTIHSRIFGPPGPSVALWMATAVFQFSGFTRQGM